MVDRADELLDLREKLIFAPLIVMVFWMGVYPKSFLDVISPSVEAMVTHYQAAQMPAGQTTLVARREARP